MLDLFIMLTVWWVLRKRHVKTSNCVSCTQRLLNNNAVLTVFSVRVISLTSTYSYIHIIPFQFFASSQVHFKRCRQEVHLVYHLTLSQAWPLPWGLDICWVTTEKVWSSVWELPLLELQPWLFHTVFDRYSDPLFSYKAVIIRPAPQSHGENYVWR